MLRYICNSNIRISLNIKMSDFEAKNEIILAGLQVYMTGYMRVE